MGIKEMVDHYVELIGTAEPKPVAVGYSFGGLIAQELLAEGVVAAAAAIDPAPIKGVKALPYAQLKSAFPVLKNPANLHRTVSLSPRSFTTHSATCSPRRNPTLCMTRGPSPVPAVHYSKMRAQTSSRTRRPKSTRTLPNGLRCC
jgi:thioesterase domain-containing protein